MDHNYTIEIDISNDGLEASIKVNASGEVAEIGLTDLVTAVRDAQVIHGVHEDALREIADRKKINQWVKVANGRNPTDGQDGKVSFCFSTEGAQARLKEDTATGRVNIRDMNLIHNVKAGDVLCELDPPRPGNPGANVRGEEIPAQGGKPAVLPGGKNVEVSPDGGKLLAIIDGMVIWDGSKVNVEPVYVVDKIDASIGNIRFNGSVVVNGEVGDGYEIHAERDVSLAMSVGRVTITAGGDITITGGILGQHKAVIAAQGNIRAKFIQDARVEACGDIVVDDYILNSDVMSGGPVVLRGPTAWIAGSTVSSEAWIYAHTIGIESSGVDSTLIVGHNPRLIEEKEALAEEVMEKIKAFIKLQSSITKLRAIRKEGDLIPQQEQLYAKIMTAVTALRTNLVALDARIEEILTKINTSYSGHVHIAGIANDGTRIMIGSASRQLVTARAAVQFVLGDDDLEEKPFGIPKELKVYLDA